MPEQERIDVEGKTIVITGASDGIGMHAAKSLAKQGANVLVTGRSPEKTAAVAKEVGSDPLVADFSRFDEVRRLASEINERVDHIDVLVNNAGGMFLHRNLTPEGHEPNFQINHLSPFLLTNLLHDKLAAAPAPRVLVTSSMGNNTGRVKMDDLDYKKRHFPQDTFVYGTSKLQNILFARELANRWETDNITGTALHPGVVRTEFGRDSWTAGLVYRTPINRLVMISPEKGSEPIVDLATRADRDAINRIFFFRHRPNGPTSRQANDADLMKALWERSEELVGL
ncbi:MAG: SDR family NAD(P)-dependent oxidoreductase [Solirubrobacterales bacterium]